MEFMGNILETLMLDANIENIKLCGEFVRGGELVAFPTETVYGLGANAFDESAVKKVYWAKGRPSDNPMIVHVHNYLMVQELVKEVGIDAKKLMKAFWPGPLTIVFNAKERVPLVTRGGLDTVAVRMPDNEIALKLIEAAGVPIAAPSANTSGRPSPTLAKHVMEDLDGRIAAIIDGGICDIGLESTVLDLSDGVPTILRPGKITAKDIEDVIGLEVCMDPAIKDDLNGNLKPKSPGMKYKHYAPKAEMIILQGSKEKIQQEIEFRKATFEGKLGVIFFDYDDTEVAARELYLALRKMDNENVDLIVAAAVSDEGLGCAVMNRMLKSASYKILKV